MTQVLGLSALAATACTKNVNETKSASDTSIKDNSNESKQTNTKTNNKTEVINNNLQSNNPTVLKQSDEDQTIHKQLEKVFTPEKIKQIIAGDKLSDNSLSQVVDKDIGKLEISNNTMGDSTPANKPDTNVAPLVNGIFSGEKPHSDLVVPAVDPREKS